MIRNWNSRASCLQVWTTICSSLTSDEAGSSPLQMLTMKECSRGLDGKPVLKRFCQEFVGKRPVEVKSGPDGCFYVVDYGSYWGVNPDDGIVMVQFHSQPSSLLSIQPNPCGLGHVNFHYIFPIPELEPAAFAGRFRAPKFPNLSQCCIQLQCVAGVLGTYRW